MTRATVVPLTLLFGLCVTTTARAQEVPSHSEMAQYFAACAGLYREMSTDTTLLEKLLGPQPAALVKKGYEHLHSSARTVTLYYLSMAQGITSPDLSALENFKDRAEVMIAGSATQASLLLKEQRLDDLDLWAAECEQSVLLQEGIRLSLLPPGRVSTTR